MKPLVFMTIAAPMAMFALASLLVMLAVNLVRDEIQVSRQSRPGRPSHSSPSGAHILGR